MELDQKQKNIFNVQTGLPLIGGLNSKVQMRIVFLLTLGSLVGMGAGFVFSAKEDAIQQNKSTYSRQLLNMVDRVEKNTIQIATGNLESVNELDQSRLKLNEIVKAFKESGLVAEGTVYLENLKSDSGMANLSEIQKEATVLNANIDAIKHNATPILNFGKAVKLINESNLKENSVYKKSLFFKTKFQAKESATQNELNIVSNIPMLIQKTSNNINILYSAPVFDRSLAFLIGKDVALLKKQVKAFAEGSEAFNINKITNKETLIALSELSKELDIYADEVSQIQKNLSSLQENKSSIYNIHQSSVELTKKINELIKITDIDEKGFGFYKYLIYLTAVLLFMSFAAMLKISYEESNLAKKIALDALRNQANEDAIADMLTEMSYVAEGILTKRLKVSNDATGSIAQAINVTVESLKDIVVNIKNASKTVYKTSEEVVSLTNELIEANEKQTDKINETIKKIGRMTSDMDEVAQKTWIAREEAEKSNAASQAGKEVVQKSVEKINSMRETIQSTAKTIKKLGESSQSIGEVVGLIKEITKQINILALNAAINAETAGEAGRAFSIVAQEVQRLADDSGDATKKIEVMIGSIQEDTNVAIAIMEKATTEMVEGAQLSEQAGKALSEIGELSDSLVSMINMVTTEIEDKSSDMTSVSLQMKDLNKSAKESTIKVQDTASKVNEMKKISLTLEDSVADFTVE